jgi:hypothetical protein
MASEKGFRMHSSAENAVTQVLARTYADWTCRCWVSSYSCFVARQRQTISGIKLFAPLDMEHALRGKVVCGGCRQPIERRGLTAVELAGGASPAQYANDRSYDPRRLVECAIAWRSEVAHGESDHIADGTELRIVSAGTSEPRPKVATSALESIAQFYDLTIHDVLNRTPNDLQSPFGPPDDRRRKFYQNAGRVTYGCSCAKTSNGESGARFLVAVPALPAAHAAFNMTPVVCVTCGERAMRMQRTPVEKLNGVTLAMARSATYNPAKHIDTRIWHESEVAGAAHPGSDPEYRQTSARVAEVAR